MNSPLDFDELNKLVELQWNEDKSGVSDVVESLLILAYQKGYNDVQEMLDYFFYDDISVESLRDAINKKTEGLTPLERVEHYVENGTLSDIQKVVTTECHRIYNHSANDTSKRVGEESGLIITKTWVTMSDPKVRDTHDYLDGMTVRLNDYFYTYNGDFTEYPGQFGVASEDINCRCWINYGLDT